jgi:Methyltransferase domain
VIAGWNELATSDNSEFSLDVGGRKASEASGRAGFAGGKGTLAFFMGLSTTLLANAVVHSLTPRPIVSIDLSPNCAQMARAGLESRKVPGREYVHLFTTSSGEAMRTMQRERRLYSFVFVDASHEYEHVKDTCSLMHDVLLPGGFCLFHDYNDSRNGNPEVAEYGVYQGVRDGLAEEHFDFYGVFGCTGLFRRRGLP